MRQNQRYSTIDIQDRYGTISNKPCRCCHGTQTPSKDTWKIIITEWGLSCWRNWEYTVLSRIKSREGLFMLEELKLDKSYWATQQFKDFINRLRKIESSTISITKIQTHTEELPYTWYVIFKTAGAPEWPNRYHFQNSGCTWMTK
jgi:hypothetical protein